MRPTRRAFVPRTLLVPGMVLAVIGSSVGTAGATTPPTRTLVPIGSDYQPDTLQRFARAAAGHDTSGHVLILVLPIAYSRNATTTTNGERQQNLTLADTRRSSVEAACEVVRSASQTCEAQLVPILSRSDAFLGSNLAFFTPDLDGMFILGGDQTVAMGVVADTPFEERMATAYADGVVVGGNSAGDAVQSVNMINGFTGSNGPAESLRQGAVDLYLSSGVHDPSRGLIFGLANAIDEQHVYEQGRIGRAINVAITTGLPVLGMDAATGGPVVDEARLTDVVGDTSAILLDPLTYAAVGHFGGPNATLSFRRMAAHLVPPGGFGYDLRLLRPTVDGAARAAPSIAGRSYPAFGTPPGSGPLLLAGGIAAGPGGTVGGRFVTGSGGPAARIVVLAAGYPKSTDAQADAKRIAAGLQSGVIAPVRWFVLDARTDGAAVTEALAGATGILLTAPDQSRVMDALASQASVVTAIRSRWSSGAATLLADNAAAAALGSRLVADAPPSKDIDLESQLDFLYGGTTVTAGLGWLTGMTVEPRLLPDRHWGQLFRLAAAQPSALAVGIDVGTAVEIQAGDAAVRGDSAAVVVDGRTATFGVGSNDAIGARWAILDGFIDGEPLRP